MVCDAHRVKWYVDTDLFSLPPIVTEADLEETALRIRDYREVSIYDVHPLDDKLGWSQ
jgi:hypothetical protein